MVFPSLFPLFPPPVEYVFLQYTSSLRLFFFQIILLLTELIIESSLATNVLPYPKLIMISSLTTDTPITSNLFLVSSIAIGSPAHSYPIISIPLSIIFQYFPLHSTFLISYIYLFYILPFRVWYSPLISLVTNLSNPKSLLARIFCQHQHISPFFPPEDLLQAFFQNSTVFSIQKIINLPPVPVLIF